MKQEFDIGDQVILQGRFTNRAGVPANPTAAHVYVKTPDGIVAEVTPFSVTAETGVYEATYAPTQTGKHYWRVTGTGTVATAAERWFTVVEQQVVPA